MRVISVKAENFASYKTLEFNFDDQGLTLIQGPTGSGKSTLCDVLPWCLFGKTAKGGTVDEILSWPGNEVTTVMAYLDKVTISRSRGPKAKDNDLMFWIVDGVKIRGKDLQDTQKLLNHLLNMDYELYLSGAYFHEFSQTAQFFTTTAKNRRTICEQLVDLSLPKKLSEKIANNTKDLKEELQEYNNLILTNEVAFDQMKNYFKLEIQRAKDWKKSHEEKLTALRYKMGAFEEDKNDQILELQNKIAALQIAPAIDDEGYSKLIANLKADLPPELEPCKECGVPKRNDHRDKALEEIAFMEKCRLDNKINGLNISKRDVLEDHLRRVKNYTNTYSEQIDELLTTENPHVHSVATGNADINSKEAEIKEFKSKHEELRINQLDLDILSESVAEFRGILIRNTILDVESKTNTLLSDYFDAEIKIELTIEDTDKLDVTIQKDGNTCSYTQLSKGQRQLLKLCFGLSVMQTVSNHHGIKFNQIFIDEALDGMDDTIKMKAVRMLETLVLEYDSIYMVEHSSEIKAHVNNKYKVGLVNGHSEITKE